MTCEGAQGGCHRGPVSEFPGDQDCEDALANIAKEREACGELVACAQHVGRADISGAHAANVAKAEEPGYQIGKRDGSQRIPDSKGND